jgi:leader peptidase (prepilin peptidase)/N-methyltransferase
MESISADQWDAIAIFASALFGLIVGSFLNVVIYRVPEKMSLSFPPSRCPSCEKPIKPYDNIPVLSYLLLGGKCRSCKTHISLRYPLVEILTSVVWAVTTWRLGREISTIGYLLFFAGLIALSMIDIDTKLLPKKIVYISGAFLVFFLTLDAIIAGDFEPLRNSVIVAAVYSGFLFILWFVTGGRAMGFGDVRLAIFLGFAMGYYGFIVSYAGLLVSLFLGAFIGIGVAIASGGGRKMKIPFGPFLAMGTIIVLWCVPFIQDLVQLNNV